MQKELEQTCPEHGLSLDLYTWDAWCCIRCLPDPVTVTVDGVTMRTGGKRPTVKLPLTEAEVRRWSW